MEVFDVIVVGGGHAGCEASHISATMGAKTLLITLNLDTIAQMSCNPAIGGIGKGHVVVEIDCLGGIMGLITDEAGIHFRLLNRSKGPAVQGPRAQCDKALYRISMKSFLEKIPNLHLYQAEVVNLLVEGKRVGGVILRDGSQIRAKAVILAPGTFLNGLIHVGLVSYPAGRANEPPSLRLPEALRRLGLKMGRLKTGTPMRLHGDTIDWNCFEPQPGDENPLPFSLRTTRKLENKILCYIGYTNERVHEIIRKNLHRSPLYTGKITGIGVRYCPSIEDKVVKFPERNRHQFFLEPEGLKTKEIYVNGVSSSLPIDVQQEILKNIKGLENAKMLRPAYGIEYDFVYPQQITHTLECREIENLFLAGQINGTTGYEEAGALGIIAGINAVLKLKEEEPFILSREEAYIGVLIDDLIQRGVDEPYRLFTSRAENRLNLRVDNCDERLLKYGLRFGTIEPSLFEKIMKRKEELKKGIEFLESERRDGFTYGHLLRSKKIKIEEVIKLLPSKYSPLNEAEIRYIKSEIIYKGYIEKEKREIKRLLRDMEMFIPDNINFREIPGLSREIVEKLEKFKPKNLYEASKISGITPSALQILRHYIKEMR
ncbi:MAG: tRNA uridine-5-carboxymethylaminomethyl(34) synthesis enzyme MnmG [Candidatus Aminicenantia bacterium]